jgi:electron transfer flavoprotein beta subunit
MKICVCVKQIRHTYAQSSLDAQNWFLAPHDTICRINPYDESALELALTFKQQHSDVQVHLLTLGPIIARSDLERCLAMGADGLYHIRTADDTFDPWAKADALARAVVHIGADLVLCGKQSLDTGNAQVGAFMAHRLKLPFVSAITELSLEEGRVRVTKNAGRGRREVIACALPALFSVDLVSKSPNLPSYKNITTARTRAFETILVADAAQAPKVRSISRFAPKPRAKQVPAPESGLPAYERVLQLLQGSAVEKKGKLVTGPVEAAVDEIVAFITESIE